MAAAAVAQALSMRKVLVPPAPGVFSVANTGMAVAVAYRFYHWPAIYAFGSTGPFMLGVAALLYFALNTVPTAAAIDADSVLRIYVGLAVDVKVVDGDVFRADDLDKCSVTR